MWIESKVELLRAAPSLLSKLLGRNFHHIEAAWSSFGEILDVHRVYLLVCRNSWVKWLLSIATQLLSTSHHQASRILVSGATVKVLGVSMRSRIRKVGSIMFNHVQPSMQLAMAHAQTRQGVRPCAACAAGASVPATQWGISGGAKFAGSDWDCSCFPQPPCDTHPSHIHMYNYVHQLSSIIIYQTLNDLRSVRMIQAASTSIFNFWTLIIFLPGGTWRRGSVANAWHSKNLGAPLRCTSSCVAIQPKTLV